VEESHSFRKDLGVEQLGKESTGKSLKSVFSNKLYSVRACPGSSQGFDAEQSF